MGTLASSSLGWQGTPTALNSWRILMSCGGVMVMDSWRKLA